MNTICYAPDINRGRRERHKPSLGTEDNKFIVSCVWCGKTLLYADLEEARKACMIERVEQTLDGYGDS
jgi:hypothetical protein